MDSVKYSGSSHYALRGSMACNRWACPTQFRGVSTGTGNRSKGLVGNYRVRDCEHMGPKTDELYSIASELRNSNFARHGKQATAYSGRTVVP